MKYRIEGEVTKSIDEKIEAQSSREAVNVARARHPGIDIQAINGEEVFYFCEGCGRPLFEDSKFVLDEDCIAICEACNR